MMMWSWIARTILRNRFWNLSILALLTIFMAFMATRVHMSYEMTQMLPTSDSTSIVYDNFKKQFGQDGSVLFMGIQSDSLFHLNVFNEWYDLTNEIKEVDGVEEVVSISRLFHLSKDTVKSKFAFLPVVPYKPRTQGELDTIKQLIYSLPLYNGLLINQKSGATLMMVTLDKKKLNTKSRVALIEDICAVSQKFQEKTKVEIHYSGLPYIRTVTSKKVQNELQLFVLLAMLVASLALYFFFRSFKAVIFPMIIVVMSVIWTIGTVGLFGYKITILTGMIPPLLIIIGVENCIFLLNKYHYEYRLHGNKVKALTRTILRIGRANVLTNATTAIGFATFIITGNKALIEFGVVASINVFVSFVLSLILIPIFFSYLKPPHASQIKYLDNRTTGKLLGFNERAVLYHRKFIYFTVLGVVLFGALGVGLLKTTGNIVDDIPKKDRLYQDMMFFEKHFNGIMPFEIVIDSGKDKGILKLSFLKKIDKLQNELSNYKELSRPLSVVEVVKFAKQAFYNGNPEYYALPDNNEMAFMASYLPEMKSKKRTLLNSFVDTNLRKTRISVQMANIGSKDIERIQNELKPKIDSIFNPSKYKVDITGTSVVFLKGTNYLITNLIESLIFAIIIIALLMAFLFASIRMIMLSMIPNLIPQLVTAAMMGYLGIPLKPSTILIFSIALGITVDNTIQFLSRYRLELKLNNGNIRESVVFALGETGYSILYSSTILVLGFSMFTLSTFGGTQAMGFLISFTMLTAMFCNLFVLPSLLLTLDKWSTTKKFKEPVFDIYYEDEIETEILAIEESINKVDESTNKKA